MEQEGIITWNMLQYLSLSFQIWHNGNISI